MKLVDLNQTIFIPVVDETHGGVTVEMKMTVGEFFARCCQGFEPEVVEAIPVNWISAYMNKAFGRVRAEIIREMLDVWMEQGGVTDG
jgi:hypothetical protein